MKYYKCSFPGKSVWFAAGNDKETTYYSFSFGEYHSFMIRKYQDGIGNFLRVMTDPGDEVKTLTKKQFLTELDKYLSETIDFLNDEIGLVWEELEEEVQE